MKKTFLFLVLAAFAIQVNAQTHFSIHAGGAFPMGDFGAYSKVDKVSLFGLNKNDKEGGASMGINLGMKIKFDIASVDGLGIIATGDIFFNGMNNDFKDDIANWCKDVFGGTAEDWDITSPKYLNIPVMIGANYTYNANNNIGLFAEAAVGMNFRNITNYSATYRDDDVVVKLSSDMATNFAFQVGAGILINEKISIGINYYSLGSSRVKGKYSEEWSTSYSSTNTTEKEKRGYLYSSILALRLGFHF